jgi:hypothetical protein
MDRNESSRLGELQSEGNLGNERSRNSERGRSSERAVNRRDEGGMRDGSRRPEDRSSDEWSPTAETEDTDDARRGGYER